MGGVGGHPPDANQRNNRPSRGGEDGTAEVTDNDHTDTRGGADAGGDGRGRWCRRRRQGATAQAQEHTFIRTQIERGDYVAGRSLQRRRSCRQARTEEFAASCLRRSQSAPGATGKRKTSEATTEQVAACKRRRSCRQARTEEFAGCCLRRSQSASGATGKRKTSEATTQQAGPCNDGGRADRHGRRSLQRPACGGANAHKDGRSTSASAQQAPAQRASTPTA